MYYMKLHILILYSIVIKLVFIKTQWGIYDFKFEDKTTLRQRNISPEDNKP